MLFFLLLLVPFVVALLYRLSYSNQLRIWASRSGFAAESYDSIKELYGFDVDGVSFIVTMKQSDANMLTIAAFHEIEQLHEAIAQAQSSHNGNTYRLHTFCAKNSFGNCFAQSSPLLVFDTLSSSMFDLSGVSTDADVVAAVQAGKVLRSATLPINQPIQTSRIFGGTTPETLQEVLSGGSDITAAKAAQINYRVLLRDDSAHDNWMRVQEKIYDAVKDFNGKSVLVEATMASGGSFNADLRDSMIDSAYLILIGLLICVLYSVVMLANGCAPERCRFGTSLVGGASILIGTAAGFGTASVLSDDVRFLSVHLGTLLLTVAVGYNAVF